MSESPNGTPTLISKISVLLATGLGVGWIPVAPGTFGTLWGIPITLLLWQLPFPYQLASVTTLCVVGIPLCGSAAHRLGLKDPGCIVWDEFVALPIVFLGYSSTEVSRPVMLVLGFLLFRLFDISKLPPGRQLERLPDGWGIMLDDVAAAIYAWASLWALQSFL